MKYCNMLVLPVLLLMIIGMSSCVRDYICQCEVKYSGQPGLPDSSVKSYPVRDTKKKAKAICEQNSFSAEDGEIKTEETCRLY